MTELPAAGLRRAGTATEGEAAAPAPGPRERASSKGRRLAKAPQKASKRARGDSPRKVRAMRVALFSSLSVARDFAVLAETGEVELVHFETDRLSRGEWGTHRAFDAVIVERQKKSGEAGVVRWLRKNAPDVPLIAFGHRAPSKGARSVFAFSLSEVPRLGVLRSLLQDARRHLEASRKAAKLTHRLRDTSRQLQVLGDIVSTANSILEPRRVVNVIMSQIQELIPSEAWSILLVDERPEISLSRWRSARRSADLNDTRIKMGEGVAGWVAQTGEPTIVNDVKRDTRFQHRFDALTRFQTRSILCAPLISRGRIIGVVEIMNRASGSPFTRKDMNLLLTLVEPAAIALENAILFQKTQQARGDGRSHQALQFALSEQVSRGGAQRAARRTARPRGDVSRSRRVQVDQRPLRPLLRKLARLIEVGWAHPEHGARRGRREPLRRGRVRRRVARYGRRWRRRRRRADPGSARRHHVFLSEFGLEARLSASFGLSLFPDHGDSPQDLMQKADQAMYSVKERGKDAVCLA